MIKRKKFSEKEALEKLQVLCSKSEKSVSDIEKKLKEWNLESESEIIVSALKKDKFLDHARFARSFARDKIFLNKWGRLKVTYLLRRHQIPEAEIEEALKKIEFDSYKNMIFSELEKKEKTLQIENLSKRKVKIMAFASQRGYEPDVINEFFEIL